MRVYEERAVTIGSRPRLVGVLTTPERQDETRPACTVVLLGAGMVHHVGPNRLMVRLARRLAARGISSVRFDHGGIGDSPARGDGKPFEASAIEEARAVMDHLDRAEGMQGFVLLGICSGAETALNTALADPRVRAVAMINGGGQGVGAEWDSYEYARRQVRHYFRRALLSADSWRRALTGRIQYRKMIAALILRMRGGFTPPAAAAVSAREKVGEIEGLTQRGVRLLWVHSEGDFSVDYFETMFGRDVRRLEASRRVRLETIPYIDHTMTACHGQERFFAIVENWLDAAHERPDARDTDVPVVAG